MSDAVEQAGRIIQGRLTIVQRPGLRFEQYFLPPNSQPVGFAIGPDQNIWFTMSPNTIGRIKTDGTKRVYPRPTGASAWDITTGPDGNLWFTDLGGDAVGRIAPDGKYLTPEFALRRKFAPGSIAVGPDGKVWVASETRSQVATISQDGAVTELSNRSAKGLAWGPDKSLWCVAHESLLAMDRNGAVNFRMMLSTGGYPVSPAFSARGELWFVDIHRHRICRMTPARDIIEFETGAELSPVTIASGPEGRMWGTAKVGSMIFSIDEQGEIAWYKAPSEKSGFTRILHGPDGTVWLLDHFRSSIVAATV